MGSVTRFAVLATTLAATAGPSTDTIDPVAPPRRGEASLRLAVPRYRIAETAGARHRVDIDGFGRASVPGSPALPFTILEVEVPDGVSAASVRLQPGAMTTRRMPGSFRIEEAAGPIVDRRHPARSSTRRIGPGRRRVGFTRASRSRCSTWSAGGARTAGADRSRASCTAPSRWTSHWASCG